jgi:hypothetical protein
MHGYHSPESVHSHHLHRLEPSLRINNGTIQLDQGLEKRERRVVDCTLPLSTRGFVRVDGVEQIRGERFHQQRLGQGSSTLTEFGISPIPHPVTGGGRDLDMIPRCSSSPGICSRKASLRFSLQGGWKFKISGWRSALTGIGEV